VRAASGPQRLRRGARGRLRPAPTIKRRPWTMRFGGVRIQPARRDPDGSTVARTCNRCRSGVGVSSDVLCHTTRGFRRMSCRSAVTVLGRGRTTFSCRAMLPNRHARRFLRVDLRRPEGRDQGWAAGCVFSVWFGQRPSQPAPRVAATDGPAALTTSYRFLRVHAQARAARWAKRGVC
jgi:hypothetical protein